MKKVINDMPGLNKRVLQLIEAHSNGSVNQFAKTIGYSQQRVNRFFNIDRNNGKYPLITTDILVAINQIFVNIDPDWLLSGRGEMYRAQNRDKANQLFPEYKVTDSPRQAVAEPSGKYNSDKDKVIDALNRLVDTQDRLIQSLEREIKSK